MQQTTFVPIVETSPTVAVSPAPPWSDVFAPVLAYPIDEGSSAVALIRLHPGSEASVAVAGGATTTGLAFDGTRVTLPITPAAASTGLTFGQSIGGMTTSATAVVVAGAGGPIDIRTPFAVEVGARAIAVSGMAPGSVVTVKDTPSGVVLGSAAVGEPFALVPLEVGASSAMTVEAARGGVTVSRSATTRTWQQLGAAVTTSHEVLGPQPFSGPCTTPSDPLCWLPSNQYVRTPYVRYSPKQTTALAFIMHGNNGLSSGTLCDDGTSLGFVPGDPDPFIALSLNQQDCYLAYSKLGQELASQGFDVFSMAVVPTGVNGTPRGVYLHEFVLKVLAVHGLSSSLPIVLIGHSLGGDAAVDAAESLVTGAGLDIVGIVGLAPAGFPAAILGHTSVPTLVLHSEEDGFWSPSFPNARYFNFTAIDADVAIVTLPGGAHAYFNDMWMPAEHLDDPHMSREAQLDITSVLSRQFALFMTSGTPGAGFLHAYNGVTWPVGRHAWRMRAWWRSGGRTVINDFEDLVLTEGNLGLACGTTGTAVTTEGTSFPPVDLLHRGSLARIAWTDAGSWSCNLGGHAAAASHVLTFDVVVDGVSSLNIPYLPVDFKIRLRDGQGEQAVVWAGAFGAVDFPLLQQVGTPDALRHNLETLTVPLSSFVAINPALDLSDLDRVTLRFPANSQGAILIDNLEFRGP